MCIMKVNIMHMLTLITLFQILHISIKFLKSKIPSPYHKAELYVLKNSTVVAVQFSS